MPVLATFRRMMDDQFDSLWRKFVARGHDVVVPAPNAKDLVEHRHSFFERIKYDQFEQVVFHNIGTGIARLPLDYLKYIQFKIDRIAAMSLKHVCIFIFSLTRKNLSLIMSEWRRWCSTATKARRRR